MEYVNINSLTTKYTTPPEIRESLLIKYDDETPSDHIITTDGLEIIRGRDIVNEAIASNKKILPVRRVAYIKPTKNFPKRVLLELTSKCNSECTMCPRNVFTRKQQHMDTKLAKKIISDLADTGISGIWLFNLGESLTHPDFFEILSHCRAVGNLGTIWLSTNGAIVKKRMREKLLSNPVDILNYSINAMTEDSFKKVSPKLKFEVIQNNFKELSYRKKESKVRKPLLRAQMIKIPYLINEIEDFKNEFAGIADILSINELEQFSQNVEANNDDEIITKNKITKCNRIDREDFMIFSDGRVSICDTDFDCNFNIGNLTSRTVSDVFMGDKYQSILKLYQSGRLHELELCAKCMDYDL